MASLHTGRTSRLGSQIARSVTSLSNRKMSIAREPMTVAPGLRCQTCPSCGFEVRVIKAPWGDAARGIKDKSPMLCSHDTYGAAVCGRTTVPCDGSYTSANDFKIKE